jgi:hypothetical protein
MDYLDDIPYESLQTIEFGVNLLDFSEAVRADEIATALIPLGAKLESGGDEEVRVDITGVNGGLDYITDADAAAVFGTIYAVEYWDDVSLPENLLAKARVRLNELSKGVSTLTLTAVDLSLIDKTIDEFGMLEYVQVKDLAHGFDSRLLVRKMSIDLTNPENSKLVIGREAKGLSSFTADTKKQVEKVISDYVTGEKLTEVRNKLTGEIDGMAAYLDGKLEYIHLAWANNQAGTSGFSTTVSTGKSYIGIYSDNQTAGSTDPSKYAWSLIKGADGSQGLPGPPGTDGQTPYFHTAWANSADGTVGFSTTVSTGKLYLGTYADYTAADSSAPSKYAWSLIKGDKGDTGDTGSQGVPGTPGTNGQTLYTWLKYADTPTTGMSDSPTGKTYMGLAYNKASAAESSVYADYTWSLIKGADGVPGTPGTNGQTLYTWVKYADSPTSGMSDSPTNKAYIGLAYNKSTATESTVYTDYTWSLIKGADGAAGAAGAPGASAYFYQAWADSADGTLNFSATDPDRMYLGTYASNTAPIPNVNDPANYKWIELAKKVEEDFDDKLTGIYNDILSVYTAITQESDNIRMEVGANYVSENDHAIDISDLYTMLQQTADSFTFYFNNLQQQITDVDGGTQAQFSETSKYIRFIDGAIEIGEEDNPLTIRISNNRMSFLQSGLEIAYVSESKLFITDAEMLNSLQIGRFAFFPRASGNTSFRRVI